MRNLSTANLAPDMAARLEQQIAELIEVGNRVGVGPAAIDNAVATAQRNAAGLWSLSGSLLQTCNSN
jgi:hypothetical protein